MKSHEVYNTYMDLLEYADTLGFDGIGVNENHQNGYGIMPSPNIIAAGLAQRSKNAALVVLVNFIALYNPAIPAGMKRLGPRIDVLRKISKI